MTHTNTEAVSDERLAKLIEECEQAEGVSIGGWRFKSDYVSFAHFKQIAILAREALSRRSASNAGRVEVERFEPFADEADGEFKGMGAVPDGDWVRYSDWALERGAYTAAHAEVVRLSSLAAEAEPVAQGSCASCNGTGDLGGNPSYGMCPDCDGTGKFPPTHPSSSVSAEVTVTDMDAAVRALHEALGGNGWAYTNYGNDELNSRRTELEAGVRAVAASINGGRDNG